MHQLVDTLASSTSAIPSTALVGRLCQRRFAVSCFTGQLVTDPMAQTRLWPFCFDNLRQPLVTQKNSANRAPPNRMEMVAAGTLIGHISTLLGVSGGAMTVPYLVLRGGDMRQAVVISSAVAIPISFIGAVGLALTGPQTPQTWGYVHWPAFLGISAVSIVFANWGARLSQRMDKRKLQLAFAGFLALVALHMLIF